MQTLAVMFVFATTAVFSGYAFSLDGLQDDLANAASGMNFGESKMHLECVGHNCGGAEAGASAGASSGSAGLGLHGADAGASAGASAGSDGGYGDGAAAGAAAGASSGAA